MSARHKKRRQDALRAILTVALCGACAYVALATAVGGFIAENIIAPIFRGISGQDEAQSALALSPGQVEESPVKAQTLPALASWSISYFSPEYRRIWSIFSSQGVSSLPVPASSSLTLSLPPVIFT